MTARIDPVRALVLAVGIERYDYGAGMDLPGAADEAVRFARWALGCGVPPDRVMLACSRLEELAEPVDGVRTVGTARDAIERAILGTASAEGDLLLVYWCGHGVLNDRGERALFTSDASVANKRNVLVEELFAFLASTALTGFGRQILLIDACANFVEDMRFDEALPHATLPKGTNREVAQFALFAAAQGQIADFNRTQRQATFSTAVLSWLEQHAAAELPPDVTGLACHVDDVFERLREEGKLRQTPVYRSVRFYSGQEEVHRLAGGTPVAGTVQAAVRATDMTVSQVRRVAEAVAASPLLATPADRLRLVASLDGVPDPGAVDDLDVVDLVIRYVA